MLLPQERLWLKWQPQFRNSGGVVGFFAGENDMDAFDEQLVPFWRGDDAVLSGGKRFGCECNRGICYCGKGFNRIGKYCSQQWRCRGLLYRENDMDTFGEKLVPFGRAMKSYSDAIAGIDVEAVTNSRNGWQSSG